MICNTVLIVVVVVYNVSLTVNIVLLPFKRSISTTTHHMLMHTPTSLLSELTDTSAAVNVCVGSNNNMQCLQLSLHMNEHATWVISATSTQSQHQRKGIKTYNKTLSNTYQCVDPTLYYFSLLQYQNGYISKDMFSFTTTTTTTTYNDVLVIPKYNFLLCEQYNYIDNNSGVLGLASNTNAHHFLSHTNFFTQLNAYYNNTLSLQFSFEYNNNILSEGLNDISALTHGNVIIGEAQLYKGTYVNDNIIQNKNDKYIWGGHINSITFRSSSSKAGSNVVVNEQFEYELAFEFGYIFLPGKLHVKLLELFFTNMIHNNICNELQFRTFYYGYICDIHKERDIIRTFPQLHITFNYGSIILHANDLFIKDTTTNSIICLLVFPSEEYGGNGVSARWKLGAPFFKRQYMLFHYNNNTISYYIGDGSSSSSSNSTMKMLLVCVISIMCVICCILLLFVFKLFIYKYI